MRFGGDGPRAGAGVGLYFAGNGAVFAALLPWYPLLVERLGLASWQFGLVVACYAAGSLLSSALPAVFIARFGAHRVVIVGTVLLGAAAAATAWSVNGVMMAVCLLLLGCCDAIVDVAQNVVGIAVQDNLNRTILSSMHALWSLGGLLSGAAATAAASSGADMRVWLVIIAVIAVILTLSGRRLIGDVAAPRRMTDSDAHGSASEAVRDEAAPAQASRFGRSKRTVLFAALPLAIVAVCGAAVEDIANNWAGLAAVDFANVPAASAGIAFSVVIGSQCLGRFSGDVLVSRFGAGRIARIGGSLIAVGGIGAVFAQEPVVLLIGLGLLGYGSATLVPGALGAAARLPGIGQAGGVTLVNWLMRVGFLGTSPLVGLIAAGAGLRWGMGLLILVGVLTVVFAPRLDVPESGRP
ncbi:MFS transporter [Brevibacterium spongiae]|uniref:MFS transporter n=1 Tax=Brevibacterium spongiae TaxID=2909672 RepID=A0ABY5SL20_9MICO|nr:MFS transporter [Brevibacterium spongiae]UVI34661.1 MFS transporter [Brevibacterium spongiae]